MPTKFLFTLEALEARHGDALLLHFGDPKAPKLIVIDGGPRGVYNARVGPRLTELKAERVPAGQLAIELAIVSHLDDDHIAGIIDLADKISDKVDAGATPPFKIVELWNNTFDDIVGKADPASLAETDAISASVDAAPDVAAHHHDAAAVIATVGQGRTLRNLAAKLAIQVNANKPLMLENDKAVVPTGSHGDLALHVLCPNDDKIKDLHVEWDKKVKAGHWAVNPASVAEYVDTSVYNLSSIVVLAEYQKKRMLLCGDARGDDILSACKRSPLWKHKPPYKVDILKVPHHGSDRNVATDFFEQIPADHYVISADGNYGNPEMATLDMIVDARGDADYVVHLTNRKGKKNLTAKLTKRLATYPKKTRDKFVFRDEADPSIVIDLGVALA